MYITVPDVHHRMMSRFGALGEVVWSGGRVHPRG
jgi:hypothetical protein